MLLSVLLLTQFVGDGWINVYNTEECMYQVEFENTVAIPINGPLEVDDRIVIWVERGEGDKPDTLFVVDKTSGKTYSEVVEDESTDSICVGYDTMM